MQTATQLRQRVLSLSVKAVLAASGLPLIVFGPGQAEVDNELLVAVAEATKGERLAIGHL